MRKRNSITFINLLAIFSIMLGGAGCSNRISGQSPAEEHNPFITDRVATVRIVMTEEDWSATQLNAPDEQYVQADLWYDNELIPDVAVRPKGNTSLKWVYEMGSPRFSFKVDFNLFNPARTFRGLKKLNFNNGWADPTLIRERLAYELFDQMGVPAPRTSHVDLWINDSHLGVYTQVEQIDKTFLQQHFPANNGNLYKPENPASFLDWTEADLEKQLAKLAASRQDNLDNNRQINLGGGKWDEIIQALQQGEKVEEAIAHEPRDYLEQMGLKTNENSPDHSALLRFLDILNNAPDETFPDEIEKVLDVDSVLRFLAVSTLIVNVDSYLGRGPNYYLCEDGGKFTLMPWDLNGAFGGYKCNLKADEIIGFYIDEPTCRSIADRPLIKRLLSHQPYLDTYHGYLQALLDGPFSTDRMGSRIDDLSDLIRPFVETDELKFYRISEFERSLTVGVGRFIGLKAFVTERNTLVREQLEGKRPSRGDGRGNRR